ncbi:hypothetical protein DYU11_31910 [Fibrisoma montanum]|uniref:Uncharacterized protein n=1 Tax=Fibrisoma montanum TaxID=2305895 RepID=A0A418LW56_9BACT|nr:hypothetical protein [Fibrisoma montanum]RIV17460.1 hypothetical protein DYU11_31910 [Fibrisoma montanum]
MRHPIEKYNQIQAEQLANFAPEEREFWARQFRIGNAAYCYQHQFNDVAGLTSNESANVPEDLIEWLEERLTTKQENRSANELLQIYFKEYLDGLPNEGFREGERAGGLEAAKRSWPFRRYVLERNDFGMDEFMRMNLSNEDYSFWIEINKP